MVLARAPGVYTPSAVHILIAEGILPHDPDPTLYKWQTYKSAQAEYEEEIVWTDTCVVYSKDGYGQRMFQFGPEDGKVSHVLIAQFPQPPDTSSPVDRSQTKSDPWKPPSPKRDHVRYGPPQRHSLNGSRSISDDLRSLVIFVGDSCQIHTFSGPTYTINVPFGVDSVAATPFGLVVQRSATTNLESRSKPQKSASDGLRPLQTSPMKYSPLANSPLRFAAMQSPSARRTTLTDGGTMDQGNSGDLPHLYTLLSPLSDLCAIACATVAPLPRYLRQDDSDVLIEYEELDHSERLVYASTSNEFAERSSAESSEPLLLFVTSNADLDQLTIWQGCYLRSKSISAAVSERKRIRASRDQHRNSLLSSVNGSKAPPIRFHEKGRESFAAATARSAHETKTARKSRSDRRSAQGDTTIKGERSMQQRLDPNFESHQKPVRSRARPGILTARPEAAVLDASRASMAPNTMHTAALRRGHSLRTSQDRRSLGTSIYRKSRGSLAASMFSKSIGQDGRDSLDIDGDSSLQDEIEVEVARALRLIEATNDLATLDRALLNPAEATRPELVLRKVHVLAVPVREPDNLTPAQDRFKVRTMPANDEKTKNGSRALMMYIHDKSSSSCIRIELQIEASHSGAVDLREAVAFPPISLFQSQEIVPNVRDIALVRQESGSKMLMLDTLGALLVQDNRLSYQKCEVPPKIRLYDAADPGNLIDVSKRDAGLKRNLSLSPRTLYLRESIAANQCFGHTPNGTSFVLQLPLGPRDESVRRAFQIVQMVLEPSHSTSVAAIWEASVAVTIERHPRALVHEMECIALLMTALSFAIGCLGPSRISKSRSSRLPPTTDHLQKAQDSYAPTTKAWQKLTQSFVKDPPNQPLRRRSSGTKWTIEDARGAILSFTDLEASVRTMLQTGCDGNLRWALSTDGHNNRVLDSFRIMLALDLYRRELQIDTSQDLTTKRFCDYLTACTAQIGSYLRLKSWDFDHESPLSLQIGLIDYDFSPSIISDVSILEQYSTPMSMLLNDSFNATAHETAVKLRIINLKHPSSRYSKPGSGHLKTTVALKKVDEIARKCQAASIATIEALQDNDLDATMIERFSEPDVMIIREHMSKAQKDPSLIWSESLLQLVDRADRSADVQSKTQPSLDIPEALTVVHDVQTTLHATDRSILTIRSQEADRHAIIVQIFTDDRRFVDAVRLTNPSILQMAQCTPLPEWSDIDLLEEQKKVMQYVMTRTVALPIGNALLHYESQEPLLSEKFQVPGFSMLCQMKPTDNTVSADRSGFTEEKFSWAFFHAGASAGLHISSKAKGIDTSWIVFTKPPDLTNRHAGFLLALGLNGHLRNMAKWLAFKYLTPKHTMTSIGLLLGLSASYRGTMDTLITRMLSVHITRMLPPDAADLNVSPLTQTAGILGVGLLYYGTDHRRMSEIMLSELEHRGSEETGSITDTLRDESYRLAAGLALGLINTGQGSRMQGKNGFALPERLLSIAIGPRPVDLVHIIDKATAGAVMALALIYMKTNDESMAKAVSPPKSILQLEHVRPDILLLRTTAANLIMWDSIESRRGWIREQLPTYCSGYFGKDGQLLPFAQPRSTDVPLYNLLTGHAWSLSLKFAGSRSEAARDEILAYLDIFWEAAQQSASYYDAKLARTTIRRCIDVLALSVATIMAGSGDLITFRYLRRLHGRTDAETTYGSHMAAHLAVGALFLGGGTYTFSTSNIAIAGLMIAFYPLYPGDVLDNAVHLQAFRHLWVLAAEPRCIVVHELDSRRPVSTPILVRLKSGQTLDMRAPCLLPELDVISSIETLDPTYWRAGFDFARNPDHLQSFKRTQTLVVRKAPISKVNALTFSRSLMSLSERQQIPEHVHLWSWLVRRTRLGCFGVDDLSVILPHSQTSETQIEERANTVDDRLAIWSDANSSDTRALMSVRALLRWAEKQESKDGEGLLWLGDAFVARLAALIQDRSRRLATS